MVGSSNLTLAGFSGNTELNVRVTGDAEMGALRDWFEALWEDSEDISEELQVKLEFSWALAKTPPYHVYLKASTNFITAGPGRASCRCRRATTNWPTSSWTRCARLAMIDIHGGCYIGDVVGLGKTFIGAELLRQLQFSYPNDGRPLISAPPGSSRCGSRSTNASNSAAAVISHSMIAPSGEAEFDEDLGRYVDAAPPERGIVLSQEYPDRGPVLVDEAHNFRNRNQRYAGLEEYLEGRRPQGGAAQRHAPEPRTAGHLPPAQPVPGRHRSRPAHRAPRPAGLFRERAALARLPGGEATYEAEYEAWQREHPTPTPPVPPARPTVPRADITQVLSPLFIRRRRRDIRDLMAIPRPSRASLCASPTRYSRMLTTGSTASTPGREPSRRSRTRWSHMRPRGIAPPRYLDDEFKTRLSTGGAARERPDRRLDEGAPAQAARVERRGVPLHARLANPQQPPLPRGA